MIVLLDATVLVKDPLCTGVAWRVLAHRSPDWNVDIRITEVVLAEAIAGYHRRIDEALVGFDRWSEKHASVLGLSSVANTARDDMDAARALYVEKLQSLLRSADIKVIPPVDTPHMELVKRATDRRKPCDQHGNGYRDTLNWLTLISIAKEQSNQEVLWITDNTRDFIDESGLGFHVQLIEEMAAIGLKNIRWVASLQDLALEVATNLGAAKESDLRAVEARLRDEAIIEFLIKHLLASPALPGLDPLGCGLPLETERAEIGAYRYPDKVSVTVHGIADDEALVDFSAEIDATIELEPRPGMSFTDPWVALIEDGPSSPGITKKRLIVRGIMALGDYGRPVAGELTRIEALPDDPGRALWEARGTLQQMRHLDYSRAVRQVAEHTSGAAYGLAFRQAAEQLAKVDHTRAVAEAAELFAKTDYTQNLRQALLRLASPDFSLTVREAAEQLRRSGFPPSQETDDEEASKPATHEEEQATSEGNEVLPDEGQEDK